MIFNIFADVDFDHCVTSLDLGILSSLANVPSIIGFAPMAILISMLGMLGLGALKLDRT